MRYYFPHFDYKKRDKRIHYHSLHTCSAYPNKHPFVIYFLDLMKHEIKKWDYVKFGTRVRSFMLGHVGFVPRYKISYPVHETKAKQLHAQV
jgi:hypothetical protein